MLSDLVREKEKLEDEVKVLRKRNEVLNNLESSILFKPLTYLEKLRRRINKYTDM
jgi:hypothetical protein